MQKILIEFTYVINGKEYCAQCEPNSPLPDVKEFAYMFMKELGQIEDQQNMQVQQSKAAEEASKKEEEQKPA